LHRLTVALDPPYDVVVGPGAVAELAPLVGGYRRVAVVTHPELERVLSPVVDTIRGIRDDALLVHFDQGESSKTLVTVEHLCRAFAAGGLLRGDAVVALGGGVVGDTAGFAAAVYHRGVAVVHVPTTVLAQVDAAIGGKTAVNVPEGKNLVGAFHQPEGVLADTSVLATLPDRELRCGLGEVAKYALMPEGAVVADLVERFGGRIHARDAAVLEEVVAACAGIKAGVVAQDPEERRGLRERLNLGHTLAHALETTSGHELAHGECVAIGLVFATELAHSLERVGPDALDRVEKLLSALDLPRRVPEGAAGADALLDVMRRDKKAKGGLTFVLPGRDGLERVDDPPARAIAHAFAAVGVRT
jgi:5-deoxy-5-amino-3-dehydroquinate synthase